MTYFRYANNGSFSIIAFCCMVNILDLRLSRSFLAFFIVSVGSYLLIPGGLQWANWKTQTGDEWCYTWSRQHKKWYQCPCTTIYCHWEGWRMWGNGFMFFVNQNSEIILHKSNGSVLGVFLRFSCVCFCFNLLCKIMLLLTIDWLQFVT